MNPVRVVPVKNTNNVMAGLNDFHLLPPTTIREQQVMAGSWSVSVTVKWL